MDTLAVLLGIIYLMAVIYAANKVELEHWNIAALQTMLYALVTFMGLLLFVTLISLWMPLPALGNIAPAQRLDSLTLVLSVLLAVAAVSGSVIIIRSETARYRVPAFISEPSTYSPRSPVHMAAIVLILCIVCGQVLTYLSGGGIEGIAEDVALNGISFTGLALNTLLWVGASLLGVGYLLRRDGLQTLERLGLRWPTRADVWGGILTGLALFGLSIVFTMLWRALASPEQFEQQNQAAQQIAMSVDRFALVLLLSGAAAVGEEIFMRGALQPVFGVVLTSAFFATLHAQYLFAPSMLFIFAVSVGFGLLRRRTSTTAAMIAHFVYNFVPLLLSYLALSSMGGAS